MIDAILTWSALPGASRHHWGSDIDVIDAAALGPGARAQLVAEEFAPGGRFERLNGWLDSNMGRFGFFRPYATVQGRSPTGALASELRGSRQRRRCRC